MKKSRIIALLLAVAMIMSVVPALASSPAGGYFVDDEGIVYEKSGQNLIENPGFEDGLTGLTQNEEYYEVSSEMAHSGSNSLKAIKSTKGDGAITAYFAVEDPSASYYLSFWFANTETVARRPRVTFAFTDSSKVIPTEEDEFTEVTNAWVGAGTASNDQDMEYSHDGEWVEYSTVLKGNGNQDACKYVVLNIYGMTKDITFADDFELYELIPSDEYSDFNAAVEKWATVKMPAGSLEGFGTIDLPLDTGYDNVLVDWSSTNEELINTDTCEYASGAEESLVILKAHLYVDGHYDDIFFEYEYPYIVKSMFVPYINWLNDDVFAKLGTSVSGDLKLPDSHKIDGYHPATITWSCSKPEVISAEGKFTEPETTCYVDLIATIECNGATEATSARLKALGGNLIPEGLIMYYPFEKAAKGTKVYDESKNENVYDATITDGVDIIDGYARFTGSNSTIVLPANFATELTGSYTVSMWVNVDKGISTSAGMYRFFDLGSDSYHSQFLRYIPGSGQLSFMDRGTVENGNTWAIDTTLSGIAQTWKFITLTYEKGSNSSVATVYVDGAQLATSGNNTTLKNSIFDIVGKSCTTGYIGRTQWYNDDNPDFMGLMDDIRIYNRAITSDEIVTLYNETRPTITAPVTIKFKDVEGNTIKDDVLVSADVKADYDVPDSYKNLPSTSDDKFRYTYTYVPSKSTDSIYVSDTSENVCELIFTMEVKPKGGNLIDNPSFEDGLTGWTTGNYTKPMENGVSGIVLATDATKGSYSLKLTSAAGSASEGAMSTRWAVDPNTEYEFSYDIKHNRGDKTTTGFLELLDANGANLGHIAGDQPGKVWSGSGEYVPTNSDGSWTSIKYVFTTTANTTMLGLKLAWCDSATPITVDNFKLKIAGTPDVEEEEPDDVEKVPITINFVDAEGNTLRKSETVEVPLGTQEYTVDAQYKSLADTYEGALVYKYVYNAELSNDTVSVSIVKDNVCTIVFDVLKADMNANLITDGSFEDGNGNFSWGTWQSPETGEYFANKCEGWFYKVNRATNESALYKESDIAAEDYALGTRWNDGEKGLCSMMNFIPVKKGKTYIVSYDYKHSNPSQANNTYIRTTFQKNNTYTANDANNNNIPMNVTSDWQTNTFTIKATDDGYIYFHFYYLGESSNQGNGPFWYFDNFEVLEVITFENKITYSAGKASIVAADGTEGYLVQAVYEDDTLVNIVVSDKLTFSQEIPVVVDVTPGAKLMVVKDLQSIEPITRAVMAE